MYRRLGALVALAVFVTAVATGAGCKSSDPAGNGGAAAKNGGGQAMTDYKCAKCPKTAKAAQGAAAPSC